MAKKTTRQDGWKRRAVCFPEDLWAQVHALAHKKSTQEGYRVTASGLVQKFVRDGLVREQEAKP